MPEPLCFVLMPFGRKRDPAGGADLDFDRCYEMAIQPAIRDAGLEPLRADREATAGIIHKVMFERLLLCDFAIADLTTANANVFYELGVRHAARPHTTLMIFAEQQPMPFDVSLLRAVPYKLGPQNTLGDAEAKELRAALSKRLTEARSLAFQQGASDSPLVQLLQGYQCPDVAHLRTDVFRAQVDYTESMRRKLADARALRPPAAAVEAIAAIAQGLAPFDGVEAGVMVDLFLSYRAVGAFDRMIALHETLPDLLKRTVLVREQLAFAVNRKAGQKGLEPGERERLREKAAATLEGIIEERGPNGETCGLLGRIYKDRWDETRDGDPARARGLLRRAIKEYTRGFEADWRDSYPGINAVTLLELDGSAASLVERDRLVPVVRYAVEQRLRGSKPDYWDHATLLELAVLGGAVERAGDHLADALAVVREYWEPETTARNLKLLHAARAERHEDVGWIAALIASLEAAANEHKGT